jgi:hypothetical protein
VHTKIMLTVKYPGVPGSVNSTDQAHNMMSNIGVGWGSNEEGLNKGFKDISYTCNKF